MNNAMVNVPAFFLSLSTETVLLQRCLLNLEESDRTSGFRSLPRV